MSKSQGNPEIGMQSESLDDANLSSGSNEFFTELESQVNGSIQDTEATQRQSSGPKQVTHTKQDNGSKNVAQSDNGVDWKKRYTDSSREAVKWRDQYKQVEKFVPVLDAMKQDSGLVEHVRDYLQSGGKPAKTVQEQLGLDEDFEFDQSEAMADPDSDSAKVMNAHVDGLVQQRVGQMINQEKARAAQIQKQASQRKQEIEFMKKNSMDEAQFAEFKAKAKSHMMTLDDVHYLLNKKEAAANVADETKKDMLNQMKNVRNMPTSASGVNSQKESKTEDRSVFESIMSFDNSVDNLFG
tara:strand:- start:16685 stop:17575 length:891 start_codon:yes stop_codon:yes gene_type:complete